MLLSQLMIATRMRCIKMARPSKVDTTLTKETLEKIGLMASKGVIDSEIAFNIGVAYSTFREWVKIHPKLSAVLKIHKQVADEKVELSLYQRAMGWEYTEETKERKYNVDTDEYEMILTKTVKKQVLPDTTAMIFWLKNRKPDEWKDRVETYNIPDDAQDEKISEYEN